MEGVKAISFTIIRPGIDKVLWFSSIIQFMSSFESFFEPFNRFLWVTLRTDMSKVDIRDLFLPPLCQHQHQHRRQSLLLLRCRRRSRGPVGKCSSTAVSKWGQKMKINGLVLMLFHGRSFFFITLMSLFQASAFGAEDPAPSSGWHSNVRLFWATVCCHRQMGVNMCLIFSPCSW